MKARTVMAVIVLTATLCSCHRNDSMLLRGASRIHVAIGLDDPMAEIQCTSGQNVCRDIVSHLEKIVSRKCATPDMSLLRIGCGFVDVDDEGWQFYDNAMTTKHCEYPVTAEDWQTLKTIMISNGISTEHAERVFHHLAE
jgi:hypothetical protein